MYAGSKKGKYMDDEQKESYRKERSKRDSGRKREYNKSERPAWKKRDNNSEKRSYGKPGERKYAGEKKPFNKDKKDFRGDRKAGGKPGFKKGIKQFKFWLF